MASLAAATGAPSPPSLAMMLPLLHTLTPGGNLSAGIVLVPIAGGSVSDAGIAVVPFGTATFQNVVLSADWRMRFTGLAGEGRGVAIRPSGVTAVVLEGPQAAPSRMSAALTRVSADPWHQSFGSVFSASAQSAELKVEADLGSAPAFLAELLVKGFTLRCTPGDEADGFLKQLLPPEGIGVTTDVALAWSAKAGLTFSNSGSLVTSLPLHAEVGPLYLEQLRLGCAFDGPIIDLTGRLDFSANLGPIGVSLSEMGVRLEWTLDNAAAKDPRFTRFGPIGINLAPIAPTGAGLTVNAGPITGGGFLDLDPDLGQYSGVMDLRVGELGLAAIGIINTKLPGGADGFALLVSIGVTFPKPVQLPLGFNLQAVGGLLALNRTMDIVALRNGLRNRTLDSILFPEDPVLNAARIISDSAAVFPVAEGRFIAGPMAKIGWGPDGIVVGDVAVIVEVPEPVVVAILGKIRAEFPKKGSALVKLNLDVLGVINFSAQTLDIDATLFDSSIMTYALSGEAALRSRWGSSPDFALAIGGFNPKYSPPVGFPDLDRVKIALFDKGDLEISAKLYLALTSNTLQAGGRVDLQYESHGAEVSGHVAVDALFTFTPFAFDVDFSGHLSAEFHGRHVAGVKVTGSLSGPAPWRAKGRAKVSVLKWDVTAKFSEEWGSSNGTSIAAVDPLPLFLEELQKPSNFGASILARRTAAESLAPSDGTGDDLLAHPAGALEFRQRLLPLDLELDKLGNASVKGHFRFEVALGVPGSQTEDINEQFARAQYVQMSASDRLSSPAFEPLKAGVRVVAAQPSLSGTPLKSPLEYETTFIKADCKHVTLTPEGNAASAGRKPLVGIGVAKVLQGSLLRQGLGAYLVDTPPRVSVREQPFVAVDPETLRGVADGVPTGQREARGSCTQVHDTVRRAAAALEPRRRRLVVPACEEAVG